jgi:hypothetical protein
MVPGVGIEPALMIKCEGSKVRFLLPIYLIRDSSHVTIHTIDTRYTHDQDI